MSDHGVPQTRKRILAVSDLEILGMMKVSHSDWKSLVNIPEAAKYVSGTSICPKRLNDVNSPFLGRKKEIKTASHFYTITTTQAHRFMDETKIISNVSVQDMVILQTFPKNYFDVPAIKLTILSKLKLNANAVPPNFSKAFFDALRRWWELPKAPLQNRHSPAPSEHSPDGVSKTVAPDPAGATKAINKKRRIQHQ